MYVHATDVLMGTKRPDSKSITR